MNRVKKNNNIRQAGALEEDSLSRNNLQKTEYPYIKEEEEAWTHTSNSKSYKCKVQNEEYIIEEITDNL